MRNRVIIAGSRGFDNKALLYERCDYYLQNLSEIEVVSGGAIGADRIGEEYAADRGYQVKRFPAQWAELGKQAGLIRNDEMARYATHLIAFWDGKSKGTKHMIYTATEWGLKKAIVRYSQNGSFKRRISDDRPSPVLTQTEERSPAAGGKAEAGGP